MTGPMLVSECPLRTKPSWVFQVIIPTINVKKKSGFHMTSLWARIGTLESLVQNLCPGKAVSMEPDILGSNSAFYELLPWAIIEFLTFSASVQSITHILFCHPNHYMRKIFFLDLFYR